MNDHYGQRAHRQKYKVGYGVEGLDRGQDKGTIPAAPAMSPREMSYAAADMDMGTGVMEKGEHVKGQLSRQRPAYIKQQKSKTRPNPV